MAFDHAWHRAFPTGHAYETKLAFQVDGADVFGALERAAAEWDGLAGVR